MFILFKQKKWVCNSQHTLLLLPSPNKCLQKELTLLISQSCCAKCDFTIISSDCNFFKKNVNSTLILEKCWTCLYSNNVYHALICCISD